MKEQIDNFNFDTSLEDLEIDFDLDFDIGIDLTKENRIHKPKYHNPFKEKSIKYSNAERLADEVGDCKERVYCILSGNFIFGDFVEALVVKQNFHVKRMIISTLSLSQENVDSLENLLVGEYVDRMDLLLSSYFWGHEKHKLIPYIFEKLDIENRFQLSISANHCKIVLIETHCGKKIVIHGSSNLRSSNCIEQICVEDNRDLFDFNMDFSGIIIEKFNTIDHEIKGNRGVKLWQDLQQETKTSQRGERKQLPRKKDLQSAKSKK